MINKQFRMILYSQSLANLGDSLYIIAIVTLIYNATGSAVTAGFFPLLRVSSQGFSGIVAPLLLDRWSLTKLLWAFEIGHIKNFNYCFYYFFNAWLGNICKECLNSIFG